MVRCGNRVLSPLTKLGHSHLARYVQPRRPRIDSNLLPQLHQYRAALLHAPDLAPLRVISLLPPLCTL